MKIIPVLNQFLERSSWVDPTNTVDRVIAGNLDKEVDRCLVTLTEYTNQNLGIEADHFPTI